MPSLALGTAAGAGVGIDKILERLMTEQKLAQQQQSIDNEQSYRMANLKQQGEYHDILERDRQDRAKMQSENQARDDRARLTTQAGTLANTIPKGKFLRATDPSVGIMQEGGFGSLLEPQEPVDPLGAGVEGPLQVDETREGGRPRGFLKDASAPQEVAAAAQRDKETDNARQASQAERQERDSAEAKRHNQAMEARPAMGSVAVIQGPSGPMVVDKPSGTAKPVTSAGGEAVGPAPTQLQRNTQQQYNKARPVLSAISDLSEKINTNQGVYAKAVGGASKLAAKANLDDDVAEYESMISGFTPLIARALGHTGVLTEQDVQSVKALFPRPGDGKSLRDRKVARIEQLMGAIEGKAPDDATGSAPKRIVYDINGKPVK